MLENTKITEDKPKPGWSFRIGLALFVLGWLCPLFIPLVTALDISAKLKAVISGALMLGIPELLWLAAAAVMGKSGFAYLKERFFSLFKKVAPPDRVSRASTVSR